MIAIRGATTIEFDSAQNVILASVELINQMVLQNNLQLCDIICLLISTTSDIKSFYPARAVRESGFNFALYSSAEPEIDNSLNHCIRFLLLVERENGSQVKHVYLHRAKNLRKDLNRISIAIDGPAGSGKSTVSKMLAQKINVAYLDTGAMYRAAALYMLDNNIDTNNQAQVDDAVANIDITTSYLEQSQLTYLNGVDVTDKLRTPNLSMAASNISKYKSVRYKLADLQRKVASNQSCVLDGRDIGTFVLPNASFKFYLTASSQARAQRRLSELRENGFDIDFNTLHKEIILRDHNDSTREVAPLAQASDAILIDTTNITAAQVVDKIIEIIGA